MSNKHVPANVFLRCDKGVTPCRLQIPRPGPNLYDEKWAVASDAIPIINVATFGVCAVTHGPCVPATMRWQQTLLGSTKIMAFGLPENPLLDDSYLPCTVGGKIDIFFTRAALTQTMAAEAEDERQAEIAKEVANEAKAKAGLLFFAAIAVAVVVVVATGGAALPLVAAAAATGAVVGGSVGAVAGGMEGYAHGGAMGAVEGAGKGLLMGAIFGAAGGAAVAAGGPASLALLQASGTMFGIATAADAFAFYKQPTLANGLVLASDIVIIFGAKVIEGKVNEQVGRRVEAAVEARSGQAAETRPGANSEKCTGTNEPVDVASGAMFFQSVDFVLPGPIPVVWERTYFSTSNYAGPLGYGWYHRYDVALWPDAEMGTVAMRRADGQLALFEAPSEANGYYGYCREHHLELRPDPAGTGYEVHSATEGFTYHFQPAPHARTAGLEHLVAISDAHGHRVRFDYSAAGHLHAVHDSVGRVVQVETDAQGHWQAVLLPQADGSAGTFAAVHHAYDAQGHLVGATNAEGHTRRFRYAGRRMVQKTFGEGTSYYYEYDAQGRCTRTWGDENYYNGRYTYTPGHTVLTSDDPATVEEYYHEQGLVTTHINPLGQAQHWRYNRHAELQAEQDALGRTTGFAYDGRGNCTTITHPDGAGEQTVFDAHDRRLAYTNAAGSTWTWTYDEQGQLAGRTDPLGATTHYQHDAEGRVSTITDAQGHATRLRYDAQHNLAHLVSPDEHIRSRHYDALGRLVGLTDARGQRQQRRYDRLGQLTAVVEPDGRETTLRYDAEGNVVRAGDGQQEVTFAYTAVNRLAERRQAGQQVRFAYDRQARLVQLTNEQGQAYGFSLDAAGRVVEEVGFDGLTRQYERDAAGQVARVARPAGRWTAYGYDAAGRVSRVNYHDGGDEQYAYDPAGNLREARTATSRVQFERDALGRVVGEQQGEHTLAYEYDARGQRTGLRSSLGAAFAWQHDALGHLTTMQAGARWQAQLLHDQDGLELQRQCSGGLRQDWQHDAAGRPISQRVSARRQPVRQRRYEWAGPDRLLAIDDSESGTTRYRYDALGTLTGAAYADGSQDVRLPDAVGNLFRSPTQTDRQYGPGGQLQQANGTRYKYDAEGNLIRKTLSTGKAWAYAWDGGGQLASVTRPDGYAVTFSYDALGRRISKRFRGQVTRWVWEGDKPLHEWAELEVGPGAGSVQQLTTWLFEEHSFAPAAKLTAAGAQSVVCDHLGTPLELYDAQGRKTWQAQLDSYGAVRAGQGRPQDCPFRYQGQYEDTETGLYYNRFRYYDPEEGRYISQDILGILGGENLYSYVDNPNFLIDSLGLLDEFGIAPYKSSLHANDNLTAHELLQNAWLRNNNKVTGREGGIARQNPAIALTESPLHKNIGDMQRARGLHNPQVLKNQSAMRNINENSVITKQGIQSELINNRGWDAQSARNFAHERVSTLRKAAIQFALDNNLISNCP